MGAQGLLGLVGRRSQDAGVGAVTALSLRVPYPAGVIGILLRFGRSFSKYTLPSNHLLAWFTDYERKLTTSFLLISSNNHPLSTAHLFSPYSTPTLRLSQNDLLPTHNLTRQPAYSRQSYHPQSPTAHRSTRFTSTERPMKVEIALDPSQLQSLASRVSAPPAAANRGGAGAGAARGGGRGGRGGGKPRTARPKPKTAEELDAEMNVSPQL